MITSGLIIYNTYIVSKGMNEYTILFSLIFILYNPIIPVHLSREIWMPINFITAGIYIFSYLRIKKNLEL